VIGYLDRKWRSVHMRLQLCHAMAIAALFLGAMSGGSVQAASEPDGYTALVKLFQQWREFEHPAIKNNVPDYSASAMAAKAAALPRWRKRLDAIDPKSWPIEQQNDYKLVKAEMNGLDFNLRVLRPWARDPAFYVNIFPSRSDIPGREGPVLYPEIELYNYHFPLDADAQKDLTTKLGMIPALLAQAKETEWTPRGWAKAKDSLTLPEQLLYLRQPGYGTCYITGKMLVDELIAEYAHQQDLAGKPFVLRDFMDRFNNEGMIPVPLMQLEMAPSSTRAFGPQQP